MEKSKESISDMFRTEGNNIFKKWKVENNQNLANTTNIIDAIICYEEAAKNATEDKENFAAYKNMSVLYTHLYSINKNINANIKKSFCIASDSIKCSLKAISYRIQFLLGEISPEENSIYVLIEQVINDISENLISNEEEKIFYFNTLNDKLHWDVPNPKSLIVLKLLNHYFIRGITEYENKNYIKSKSFLNSALILVRQACQNMTNLQDVSMRDTLIDKKDSIYFSIFRIDAQICLDEGEKLYNDAVFQSENLDMEKIMLSIDKYREAILLSRYIENTNDVDNRKTFDIEIEAIAHSQLTKIYYKIYKDRTRGYYLATYTIDLANSLYPKDITETNWYKETTQYLEEISDYQHNYIANKEKTLLSIKGEIDLLNNTFDLGDDKFIKMIINTYPPAKFSENFDVNETLKNLKTKIVELINMYHPDKLSKFDVKKYCLYEEITKILNIIYTDVNDVDNGETPK